MFSLFILHTASIDSFTVTRFPGLTVFAKKRIACAYRVSGLVLTGMKLFLAVQLLDVCSCAACKSCVRFHSILPDLLFPIHCTSLMLKRIVLRVNSSWHLSAGESLTPLKDSLNHEARCTSSKKVITSPSRRMIASRTLQRQEQSSDQV